jgi:hypothetical protein
MRGKDRPEWTRGPEVVGRLRSFLDRRGRLSKATDIARSMVARYRMWPELGPLTYEIEPSGFLSGIPQPAEPKAYGSIAGDLLSLSVVWRRHS